MLQPERCPACGDLDCDCALYQPDEPAPDTERFIDDPEDTERMASPLFVGA